MKEIQFSNIRKFFYDCEFMEEPGHLKLISIGVVGEQDQEYYACNSDAREDFPKANPWVKSNVLPRLPAEGHSSWGDEESIRKGLMIFLHPSEDNPVELWSYFADYDHVLLCWLFGSMGNLPAGMPQYTLDLVQLMYHMDLDSGSIPRQKGEVHNALDDAKYHKHLFDYLTNQVRFGL